MVRTGVATVIAATVLLCPIQASTQADGGSEREGTLLAFFGGGRSKKSPLKKKERALALSVLSTLEKEAKLLLFTEDSGCKQCGKTERLLEDLASISPFLSLRVLTLGGSPVKASAFGVERVPAVILLDGEEKDAGIRYFGLPLGFEFEAFLQAIVNTAHGTSGLRPETIAGLAAVTRPVTVTVFVARH